MIKTSTKLAPRTLTVCPVQCCKCFPCDLSRVWTSDWLQMRSSTRWTATRRSPATSTPPSPRCCPTRPVVDPPRPPDDREHLTDSVDHLADNPAHLDVQNHAHATWKTLDSFVAWQMKEPNLRVEFFCIKPTTVCFSRFVCRCKF